MRDRRRLFGPTVVLGVVGSGLVALAGAKPWAAPDLAGTATLVDQSGGHVPLAGALGLVALACWGVLLVTRGRVRRVLTVVETVVSVALVVVAALGRSSAVHSARTATVDVTARSVGVHVTGWWWVALVSSVVALAAALLAVRTSPSWPEMGSRYDAPGTRREADPAEMDEGDLWRAIDRGHDPTDDG
jgi:uncharacterized membrane protein (TIGR02234 family)